MNVLRVRSAVKRSAWLIAPVDASPSHRASPGQDRQARRVGRRPAGRAERVRAEVPDRPRSRRPAIPLPVQGVQLVELARVTVEDQGVPVAVGDRGLALDRDVRRDRIRALVALVGVFERDARLGRLLPVHHDVRDPDARAVPQPRAEVGVNRRVEPDRGDQGSRVRGDRKRVHRLIPDARRGEDRAAAERRRGGCASGEGDGGECQRGSGCGDNPHGWRSSTSHSPPRRLNE